jgi:sirohydrochlorin cobaltochelatase
MENVSVRCEGAELELPAGPFYRLEKEIKNVITVMAKTCHYWFGHTSDSHRRSIRDLMETIEAESPLLQPAFPQGELASASLRIDAYLNQRRRK